MPDNPQELAKKAAPSKADAPAKPASPKTTPAKAASGKSVSGKTSSAKTTPKAAQKPAATKSAAAPKTVPEAAQPAPGQPTFAEPAPAQPALGQAPTPGKPDEAPVSPLADLASQFWETNPFHRLIPLDVGAIFDAMSSVTSRAMADPVKATEEASEFTLKLWQEMAETWTGAAKRWAGDNVALGGREADRRFDAPEWEQNPVFRSLKKAYQLFSERLLQEAERGEMPNEARRHLAFHLKQFIDATSPHLFLPTNPAALRKAMETGGASVADGLRHLMDDLDAGRLSMTDTNAFAPGRNLALSPGKVVFRNRLIELIQYAPKGETVHKTPLLFLPPWINKFYILDLQPKNSLVAFLVEQGFTVFMVSWKNPDASMEDFTLEDYMREGPLAASEVVRSITGEQRMNVAGYCIGGTLLVMTLATLAAMGDDRFNAATLMVSLQDFTDVGDTAMFMDEPHIEFMEKQMLERGYLDSSHMSNMFNLLRPNDLIWSAVVNNYLLGNKPPAFDLLYWNADGTRMARAAHSFYLRNTYLENNLIKPGKITLLDQPVDLGNIKNDIYAIGAEKDHIVPWRAAWQIGPLTSGAVRFVLAASGHIAGMINPPASGKGNHWVNDKGDAATSPEEWQAGAQTVAGSWWGDWGRWLGARAGDLVPPPALGNETYPALCDAPGTYVLEK